MKKKLVSVVTAYYNRENYVTESIQSLLDQTYEPLEILVVDDGSTDRTLEKLQEFNDPRLKIISHTNRGLTRSFIEAIQQSKGEYIAIHGSGDINYPTRIEEQVKVLDENEDVGIVGCIVENVDTVTGSKEIFHPFIDTEDPLTQLLRANVYTHGEVIFRRSVHDRAGGYRALFKFTQDYDLWLRMALFTKFATVKKILYRRYTLPDGVSASIDKMLLQQYLAEFGRQCIEMRVKEGKDWIDRFGEQSLFFRQKSGRLSQRMFSLSKAAIWRDNDWKKAAQLIRLSLSEKWHLKGSAALVLVSIINQHEMLRERAFELVNSLRNAKRKRLSKGS